jgi:hypothetical protein
MLGVCYPLPCRHRLIKRCSDVGRTLTGPSFSNSTMTDEACVAFCQNAGYIYAGTEYASQCCKSLSGTCLAHTNLHRSSLRYYYRYFSYSSQWNNRLPDALCWQCKRTMWWYQSIVTFLEWCFSSSHESRTSSLVICWLLCVGLRCLPRSLVLTTI